eukprot:g8581.t1
MANLYRRATSLFSPVVRLKLYYRRWKGKEDPGNEFYERLGEYKHLDLQRGHHQGAVWVHGASVGESLASLPLVNQLLSNGTEKVLLTVGTRSAKMAVSSKLPDDPNCACIYVPVDTPRAVHKFLEFWAPKAGVFLESEIWPNLILAADGRGIPLGLVNARMSSRSFERWMRFKVSADLIGQLLSKFKSIQCQGEEDQRRFRQLGAANIKMLGNLKMEQAVPRKQARLPRGFEQFRARHEQCWVAGSTYAEEEDLAIGVHFEYLKKHVSGAARPEEDRSLLTVVAPRRQERLSEALERINQTCSAKNNTPVDILLWSELVHNAPQRVREGSGSSGSERRSTILVVDSIGELQHFYQYGAIALVGGSLTKHNGVGGHNFVEATRHGLQAFIGPHLRSNYKALVKSNNDRTDMYGVVEILTEAEEGQEKETLGEWIARVSTALNEANPMDISALGRRNAGSHVVDAGISSKVLEELYLSGAIPERIEH